MMNIDFHIHTKYSFDSLMKINKIIKIARKRNISGIAICDHDYFSFPKISRELKKIDNNFFLIPGMEIKTELGDLIGIMLTESINTKTFSESIDEIRSQGGISLLPHPYRRKKEIDIRKIAEKVDWLEVNNSRSTISQNNESIELCRTLNKPRTAGSDAHLYSELGRSYVTICDVGSTEEIIKEVSLDNVKIVNGISPRKVHYWSSLIGAIKTRSFGAFFKGFKKEIKSGLK